MDDDRLEHVYRDYIATLNDRGFGDLGRFVRDELTYNGEPLTLERYQSLLIDDARQIPV